MKIKKSAMLQYILIYIMLLVPASCLVAKYLSGNIRFLTVGIYIVLFCYSKKYRSKYILCSVLFLLGVTLFTRLLNGGAGMTSWLELTNCIVATYLAISCDKENFLTRYIKTVSFFATISIFFWLIFCLTPNMVNIWPATEYFTQSIGTKGYETFWHGKGLLLYSYLEMHPRRNCGFYTEPGVYQIVLNSALFVLLFWKNKLHFKRFKDYRKAIFIIIFALASCQSTTGYIGLLLNLLIFYVSNNQQDRLERKIKKWIFLIASMVVIILLVDYASRGTASVLSLQIISKLFGKSGVGLDVSNGTGQYRWGTILVSVSTIIQHPFGVGIDAFASAKNIFGSGLVAASFASFAAIYGIIPWIITLSAVFKPVIRNEKRLITLLYIALFVNTTLAQTELLYPALIMIPMCLVLEKSGEGY